MTKDFDDFVARWAPTLNTSWLNEDSKQSAASTQEADAPVHTGVMVAFYPYPVQAAELAIDGGESPENLHVTLAYLGDVGQDLAEDRREQFVNVVTGWAAGQAPVSAIINGIGLFTTPEPVTYANIDSPQLPALHQSLHAVLRAAGFAPYANHGFTPHMTLIYGDRRDLDLPAAELRFETVTVAWAGDTIVLPMKGQLAEAARQLYYDTSADQLRVANGWNWPNVTTTNNADYTVTAHGTGGLLQVGDRPIEPVITPAHEPVIEEPGEQGKAFVTDVNGRTLITAPACTVKAAMKDPTVEEITAEHMLWMHGRFVGAEVPNRNGALWSAGDLEMAQGTVTNGPLNWLHDARHVIGTLAKAEYVDPSRSTQLAGATLGEPHITATAAIWRWIYPDEAYVIQQASEQEMLWYSMECISAQVTCAGQNGCGNTVTYTEYMAGAACEHVRQRASIRRFVNPVFLGGAVIVPPTRPGWAEADARVLNSHGSALAEAAYEQAKPTAVTTSDWEQVMAQVIAFAAH